MSSKEADSIAKLLEAIMGLGGIACLLFCMLIVWSHPERAVETAVVGYILLEAAQSK